MSFLKFYPAKKNIPVLTYHYFREPDFKLNVSLERSYYYVSCSDFDAQMNYLYTRGYKTVPLDAFNDYITKGLEVFPKSILITIDDGLSDSFDYAYPILKKYKFTAVFFVVVDNIDKPGSLNLEQILEMKDNQMSIQSHTYSHLNLITLKPDEVRTELFVSKRKLEEMISTPVEFLAVPFGKYNSMVVDIAKETGYRGLFTLESGLNISGSNMFTLKRILIVKDMPLAEFAGMLKPSNIYLDGLISAFKANFRKFIGYRNTAIFRKFLFRIGLGSFIFNKNLRKIFFVFVSLVIVLIWVLIKIFII
ncbi:MAG: polysaccharide deacetylase family protein [Candidatus Omnitrophica bacterium]|nr:polysaccharide deacetylase family protein [Candidatus Omnitrophota bacterium]